VRVGMLGKLLIACVRKWGIVRQRLVGTECSSPNARHGFRIRPEISYVSTPWQPVRLCRLVTFVLKFSGALTNYVTSSNNIQRTQFRDEQPHNTVVLRSGCCL
jgi:hypothetical protein